MVLCFSLYFELKQLNAIMGECLLVCIYVQVSHELDIMNYSAKIRKILLVSNKKELILLLS